MMDGKSLSAMIRAKKKRGMHSDYRQDMDYAGQDAVDPNAAWDAKQEMEVADALNESGQEGDDHMPASEEEMGENESSQDKEQLKKAMARINKYFDTMMD